MTATLSTIAWDYSTDAYIRAIAAAFFGNLSSGGMVQTSDTGQTANNAFPRTTAGNQVSGYQIWRFADSYQATVPVFIKFELVSSTTNPCPGLAVTIGTGSDGAGAITGVLMARTVLTTGSQSAAINHYFSSSTNRFAAAFGIGGQSGYYTILVAVERSKNPATGADSNEGLIVHLITANNSSLSVYSGGYIPFTGSARAFQANATALVCKGQTTMLSGATIGLIPVTPLTITLPCNPGYNLMMYFTADISAQSQIPVTVYGTTHTYITLGVGAAYLLGWSGFNTDRYAMLFE